MNLGAFISSIAREDCLSIYADQNVFGHMLDQKGSDWRNGEFASVLLEAQRQGSAEVWVGPTNIIETLQTTDVDRRKALATMMLELAEARRIWWGHEFEAIDDFFQFLTAFAPNAIFYREYFDHRLETARLIWLGALALLAITGSVHAQPLIEDLRKLKATNRLMHARFAVDPDNWVKRMIDVVDNFKTTDANVFAEFDQMSRLQIEDEVGKLEQNIRRLDQAALAKLNKNRARISKAYGALQVGQFLTAVFRLPFEMQLIFDIPQIVENWQTLQQKVGCPPLPAEVTEADRVKLRSDRLLVQTVLQRAIFAAAKVGLITTEVSHQAVLLDLQKCINARQLPTGGLTFDGDHASAIKRFNVFICQEVSLAESLKTIAKMVEDRSGGRHIPQVVSTARQLSQVIQNRHRIPAGGQP